MDVPIRCVCPPKADGSPRHEGDTITLRDTLGFREVTTLRKYAAQVDTDDPLFVAEIQGSLVEGYVVLGVERWTLVDDKDKPLPVTRVAIREQILDNDDVAFEVGEQADELYGDKVVRPLLMRASTSSPDSPTDTSTSRPTPSSTERQPTPLKRSSTGSSPTVATGTTSDSRDGDSSSSPSSASVA